MNLQGSFLVLSLYWDDTYRGILCPIWFYESVFIEINISSIRNFGSFLSVILDFILFMLAMKKIFDSMRPDN